MSTLTPKFDRLVAKARKAGHNVEVTEEKLKKGAIATVRKSASVGVRSLANVTVYGTTECLNKNTSFKL